MELAPDDDMNGLFGIEPGSAEATRPAPAVAVPPVRTATVRLTASNERRRGTRRTSTTRGRCPGGYGRAGPMVGTGRLGDALGCGTGAGPPPADDGLGDGLGLGDDFGDVLDVEPGFGLAFAGRLRCAAAFFWCRRCFL